MDYLDKPDPQTFIAHHGIKGQKWGVRRFQNADGSLTKAGKERYNEQNSSDSSDNHENQKFHLCFWKSLFPITSSDTQKQSIPVKLKED